MLAEIISVGNELLAGTTLNTNTVFLARNLGLMGFGVHRQSVVGDVEADIMEAVKTAGARSHVVILTGGLGPTEDDLTKEAVAKTFNLSLVESDEVTRQIKTFFEQRGKEVSENNFKQAMVIKGSDVLANPNGTAPGLLLQTDTQAIAMLPGPPAEMEPMFENELKPRLARMSQDVSIGTSLHVFGIGESELEERVKDLLYEKNPTAALYAKPGEVYIDIVSRGASKDEAQRRLERKVHEFKQRVGDGIYSDNGKSLAETVVELLGQSDSHIAVAESCTGGLMAARITEVNGASKVFDYGVSAYADWVKQSSLSVDKQVIRKYTSVSSATAAEMAKGARVKGNADIGVGITGIAGPTTGDFIDKPVGLIFVAVADKKKVLVKKFNFSNMRSRITIRELSVQSAFDMVRRLLLGLEIEGARKFANSQLADIDRTGKPKNKSSLAVQKAVTSMLLLAVLAGGLLAGVQALRSRLNTSVYNSLKGSFVETSADGSRAIIGFDNLTSRNPDTMGWILIDESSIDSVVVGGREDDYYCDHDFDGSRNTLGCLYIDSAIDLRNDPDNIVVYGSSADASQLFGPLRNFTDINYLADNGNINFYSLYGSADYKVLAVLYADESEGDALYRQSVFETAEDFANFVVDIKMRSVVNVNIDIISGDTFLTLVTEVPDWEGAQLVVIARQLRLGEDTAYNKAMLSRNIAAAYPDEWYTVSGTTPVHNEVVERDRWANWLLSNEKAVTSGESSSGQTGGSLQDGHISDSPYVSATNEGDTLITVFMNGEEYTDSPVNVVSRMVAHEIGTSASVESTKAQAVACATWLRYNYSNGFMPIVSGNGPNERLVGLVEEVIGEGMYYNGEIAYTPYFEIASSNTYSAQEVLGMDLPYLASVESRYDYMAVGYTRTTNVSRDAVKGRIESVYGIKLSADIQNWIQITERSASGLILKISIDGQLEVSGTEFAENCMMLRSANFTMQVYESSISFVTTGYGHGVGMSKYGAEQYASRVGWSYRQILEHYYPGVSFDELVW